MCSHVPSLDARTASSLALQVVTQASNTKGEEHAKSEEKAHLLSQPPGNHGHGTAAVTTGPFTPSLSHVTHAAAFSQPCLQPRGAPRVTRL